MKLIGNAGAAAIMAIAVPMAAAERKLSAIEIEMVDASATIFASRPVTAARAAIGTAIAMIAAAPALPISFMFPPFRFPFSVT